MVGNPAAGGWVVLAEIQKIAAQRPGFKVREAAQLFLRRRASVAGRQFVKALHPGEIF
jgi:hypothetical protein